MPRSRNALASVNIAWLSEWNALSVTNWNL
jgi:hypothetical protein